MRRLTTLSGSSGDAVSNGVVTDVDATTVGVVIEVLAATVSALTAPVVVMSPEDVTLAVVIG